MRPADANHFCASQQSISAIGPGRAIPGRREKSASKSGSIARPDSDAKARDPALQNAIFDLCHSGGSLDRALTVPRSLNHREGWRE
jgi:hypothetical protein